MSHEARIRKPRHCTTCCRDVYGDAAALREHDSLHRFIRRTGLTLPNTTLDVTGSIIATPYQKGTRNHGNQAK